MTEIEYYPISKFGELAVDWHRLEKGGEMSYYQTYDWFSSILPAIPVDCGRYESRFVVLRVDGMVKIIAPIWVVKKNYWKVNEAGVFMLGRSGWSDYLNFIYDDVEVEEMAFVLKDIAEHYDVRSFYFEDIPEESALYECLSRCCRVVYTRRTTCLRVELPQCSEEYLSQLSKHVRQNLRTAANRLAKDGKEIVFNFDDTGADKDICKRMRKNRLDAKVDRNDWVTTLKLKFFNLLRIKFDYGIPLDVDTQSHIMSAYIDGELAAFFNYGVDSNHRRVVVMAAGTSEKFEWYSPGMQLAYQFVVSQIAAQQVEMVDFTRGDEKYKYSLGGREHYNFNIKFIV